MNIHELDFTIRGDSTIINAMKQMDVVKRKLLLVVDEGKYKGLLSIGDIQRAIINNLALSAPVSSITRNDYIIATPHQTQEEVKKLMLQIRAEFMPVVNESSNITHIYFWKDFFLETLKEPLFKFNLPVVIMAGGKGTRLKPLTNVIPKPLIPLDEKTIIEHIFEKFALHGCNNFYISVNYKADLIEYFIKDKNLPYSLNFYREEMPLGTAGSLKLLKDKINETFFVSNCDIIVEQDYSEVLRFHRENNNEITVIAVLKTFPFAYGTLESGENGKLISLHEKPDISFKINSGMYILEPHLIDQIPNNKLFHITQLIEEVISRNGIVGVFPVSEKSWRDIGEWKEYLSQIL